MNESERLLSQLPGVYHASADLRKLLAALEGILFGGCERGLETEIREVATLLDVVRTNEELEPWLAHARDEFLPWLSQWVALSHGVGLPAEKLRQLVGRAVPLYAWRGTKHYLIEMLRFYLPEDSDVRVEDQRFTGFVVGSARVGLDTWLEQDRPFWFKVTVHLPGADAAAGGGSRGQEEWQKRIRKVIELAKPAHTTYDLEWGQA